MLIADLLFEAKSVAKTQPKRQLLIAYVTFGVFDPIADPNNVKRVIQFFGIAVVS